MSGTARVPATTAPARSLNGRNASGAGLTGLTYWPLRRPPGHELLRLSRSGGEQLAERRSHSVLTSLRFTAPRVRHNIFAWRITELWPNLGELSTLGGRGTSARLKTTYRNIANNPINCFIDCAPVRPRTISVRLSGFGAIAIRGDGVSAGGGRAATPVKQLLQSKSEVGAAATLGRWSECESFCYHIHLSRPISLSLGHQAPRTLCPYSALSPQRPSAGILIEVPYFLTVLSLRALW